MVRRVSILLLEAGGLLRVHAAGATLEVRAGNLAAAVETFAGLGLPRSGRAGVPIGRFLPAPCSPVVGIDCDRLRKARRGREAEAVDALVQLEGSQGSQQGAEQQVSDMMASAAKQGRGRDASADGILDNLGALVVRQGRHS